MKSPRLIFFEGLLYVIISSGAPWAEFLHSDRPVTERALIAVTVVSVIAGATALKAFLSQNTSNTTPPPPSTPVKAEIVNTPANPVPVEEK